MNTSLKCLQSKYQKTHAGYIRNSTQPYQTILLPESQNTKHVYQKKKAVGLHDKPGHYLHRNKAGKYNVQLLNPLQSAACNSPEFLILSEDPSVGHSKLKKFWQQTKCDGWQCVHHLGGKVSILLFWTNLSNIKIIKYLGRTCTKISTPTETERRITPS